MVSRKVTHSEDYWDLIAPPTVLRCEAHYKTGGRCRREAIPGATVCGNHGGSAPQVRQRAAARIGNAADDMVRRLHAMLDDPEVEARDKIKIATDMLDRAGLNATEKHIIGLGDIDPVEALFRNLLNRPDALSPPTPALAAPPHALGSHLRPDDESDAVVAGEVLLGPSDSVEHPETMSSRPPKHVREALERELLS